MTPFTASRPDLIDMDYLSADNGVSIRQTSTGIISIPGSVQALGDVNGDGVDDVAIGTNRFDWTANSGESRTCVVYGSATPGAAKLDMTTLDGSNGLRISTVHPNTPAPDSFTAVGDVDGNDYADLGLVDGYNSTYDHRQAILVASVERSD